MAAGVIRRVAVWAAAAAALGLAAASSLWWSGRESVPPGFARANGRLEADEVHVASKFGGRLVEVRVEEGDGVSRGDALARVDSDALEAQLEAAQAAFQRAIEAHNAAGAILVRCQKEHELAERELHRTERLFAAGVGTPEDLDRRRTQVQTTEAAYDEARSRLAAAERGIEEAAARAKRLRVDLAETTLRAPVSGRVQYRLAEPGEVLEAGGRVLTLIDLGDVYMTVFLPAEQAGRVALGADARIVLDARPQDPIPARVSFVAKEAQFTPKQVETASERQKLSFRVRVRVLEGSDPRLHPGTPGVAWIHLDPTTDWPEALW